MATFKSKFKQLFVVLLVAAVMLLTFFMGISSQRASQLAYQLSEQTKFILPSRFSPVSSFQKRRSINWEELTRNDSVLTDWTRCGDSMFSTISVKGREDSYNIGDVVMVKITVKDVLGRRKKKGGDDVRIWLKDTENDARSAGYVIDNNDGSYTGVVTLLWAGHVAIEAAVKTPRELIRLFYQKFWAGLTSRQHTATFSRKAPPKTTNSRLKALTNGVYDFLKVNIIEHIFGSDDETVNCTPSINHTAHYKGVCNLTHRNSHLPWYCEKPTSFSCEDEMFIIHRFVELDFSDQEREMIKRTGEGLKMTSTVTLKVKEKVRKVIFAHESNFVLDFSPCNQLPAKDTWNTKSPVGYLYRGTWYPTLCRNTFNGAVMSFRRCMHGRTVWFLGDSNMREMMSYFKDLLSLKLTTGEWTTAKWHQASHANNVDRSVAVFWGMHALPHYFGVYVNATTYDYINSIPKNSKDIVVVHFYMHFMLYHPSIFRLHIRKAVECIKSLKTRAPDVKVVVRGPHALFLSKQIAEFHDFFGLVYTDILKEEFSSIMNDVIYLNQWDLTVALESSLPHPNVTVMKQEVNYLMSLVCP